MTVTSMLDKVLKIATRQSPLALWQAQYVKARLEQAHPGLKVELRLPMVTRGDVVIPLILRWQRWGEKAYL